MPAILTIRRAAWQERPSNIFSRNILAPDIHPSRPKSNVTFLTNHSPGKSHLPPLWVLRGNGIYPITTCTLLRLQFTVNIAKLILLKKSYYIIPSLKNTQWFPVPQLRTPSLSEFLFLYYTPNNPNHLPSSRRLCSLLQVKTAAVFVSSTVSGLCPTQMDTCTDSALETP